MSHVLAAETPSQTAFARQRSRPASDPAIDLVQLSRVSGGDTALEEELLLMFSSQSGSICARLAGAMNLPAQEIADAAHKLKGSALAVAARRVAAAANEVERIARGEAGGPDLRPALTRLDTSVAEARAEIERLLS